MGKVGAPWQVTRVEEKFFLSLPPFNVSIFGKKYQNPLSYKKPKDNVGKKRKIIAQFRENQFWNFETFIKPVFLGKLLLFKDSHFMLHDISSIPIHCPNFVQLKDLPRVINFGINGCFDQNNLKSEEN